MSSFCSDQGRIHRRLKRAMAGQARGCGPRKAGQEGVRLYAAVGNPRSPARKAYASEREHRSGQKGPFLNGHYLGLGFTTYTILTLSFEPEAIFKAAGVRARLAKIVPVPFKLSRGTFSV